MLSDENSGSSSNPANRYQPSDCNGMMSCCQVRSWVLFKIYCSFKWQVSVYYEFYFIAVPSHFVFAFLYKLLKLENFAGLGIPWILWWFILFKLPKLYSPKCMFSGILPLKSASWCSAFIGLSNLLNAGMRLLPVVCCAPYLSWCL